MTIKPLQSVADNSSSRISRWRATAGLADDSEV
jgi:hypothetical protein